MGEKFNSSSSPQTTGQESRTMALSTSATETISYFQTLVFQYVNVWFLRGVFELYALKGARCAKPYRVDSSSSASAALLATALPKPLLERALDISPTFLPDFSGCRFSLQVSQSAMQPTARIWKLKGPRNVVTYSVAAFFWKDGMAWNCGVAITYIRQSSGRAALPCKF